MNNFELKISFKLGICLGSANIYIVKQTNYYLYLHYTVQCIHYNMYHTYISSVNQKQAQGDDLCENLFCDLRIGWFW